MARDCTATQGNPSAGAGIKQRFSQVLDKSAAMRSEYRLLVVLVIIIF
jgi:hypothetical protein